MKKCIYKAPTAEEVYLALEGLLAQSDETSGMIEDMPGTVIFEN